MIRNIEIIQIIIIIPLMYVNIVKIHINQINQAIN